jgi:hypothetical protein
MYGRQIGTLLFALNEQVIWSLSDNQEDDWLLGYWEKFLFLKDRMK